MTFIKPSDAPTIPTYRVMDSNGVIIDDNIQLDVSNEEVLTWYKNMLTGLYTRLS